MTDTARLAVILSALTVAPVLAGLIVADVVRYTRGRGRRR